MDRASILGDAIQYVQELQKEEKDLQNELARNSDDEDHNDMSMDHHLLRHPHQLHQANFSQEVLNAHGPRFGADLELEKPRNGYHLGGGSESFRRSHDFESPSDKAQQMEVLHNIVAL